MSIKVMGSNFHHLFSVELPTLNVSQINAIKIETIKIIKMMLPPAVVAYCALVFMLPKITKNEKRKTEIE